MPRLILSISFILVTSCVYAQQPYMWQITDEDGLPSMEVYNVMQDSKSYIWLGTDNGVCRYDGKQFKIYYHPKQRGKSFSYLIEDKEHRIWTINFAGQIFYIENDSMHLFEPFEKVYKSGFPRFCFDNKNQLWIISPENPTYYYNFEEQKLHSITKPRSFLSVNILADKSGDVVIVDDSIYVMRHNKLAQTFANNASLQYSIYDTTLYGFLQPNNPNNLSSFSTLYGFKKLNSTVLQQNTAKATDFASFSPTNRWLLTYDGAFHFASTPDTSYLYSRVLKGYAISWLMRDKENNYWLSTLKNGVFVIPSTNVWLMNKENSKLENNRIVKIAEDKNGLLYLGGGKGIITIFNPKTKQIVSSIQLSSDNKDIDALSIDQKSNLLYAQTNRTSIYDIGKKKTLQSFINFSSVKDISFDKYGNYLVATNYQSHFVLNNNFGKQSTYYRQNTFETRTYPNDDDRAPLTMANLRVQRTTASQVRESDSSLWVAYVDGLYYFKNGKEYALKDEKGNHIFGTDFSLSPNGVLWVATVQQGVFGIYHSKIIVHLTQKDGLKSNYIRCVKSTNSMIWLGTDKGVQGFDLISKKLSQFTREDGLVTNDVMDIYIKDNVIYLATSKGLQWFAPNELHTNRVAPPIYIETLTVNDSLLPLHNEHSLSFNQNNISILFNGIALSSRGSMQYAYRLIGLDSNWIIIPSSENIARFNALPSGKYTFEVKAINEDNIASKQTAAVSFIINAPYWQKWWFVLLELLAVVVLVSIGFLVRINVLRKRNKLERDKNKLEVELRTSQLAALKVQMNPHFIFNSLNSIQEYILTNEKKLANSYLGKFSDLMRLYLDMSNKTSIALSEEIRAMELYLELEAMRFETNFSYALDVANDVEVDDIQIPAMIIQPYVENAIKHGLLHRRTQRTLSIQFKKGSNETLVCVVHDNGIGRKQSQELNTIRNRTYTSFATGATQKRLELLNVERKTQIGVVYEDLYHTDGSALGTRVTVTIPIHP